MSEDPKDSSWQNEIVDWSNKLNDINDKYNALPNPSSNSMEIVELKLKDIEVKIDNLE